MAIRIGQGFDVHQLVEGRRCVIGGVTLPYEKGLLGYTDADVLVHAIIDAILGAAGLGDIGQQFPETEAKYEGASSLLLLEEVVKKIKAKGFTIGNIDCTILAEKPKMLPYLADMTQRIAKVCQITVQQLAIKATTMETMGFVGRQEGIGAIAVALLEDKKERGDDND
ncbi:2-C-methyl-D-erythritol 2,4-cyclodiphosphate synthase [Vagococcus intermedius]|uniref:2-C-methyl-D-erythritol 2,4-cyclodiphosphate synthase n=1 Tax=Vagococcus intermedius TaxID=2991418 RepID=A0AAF0CUD3_9ENTE|nr:2-C-methyl-D-erythritol 2,4-cyclodiphosphate synthase [Vagococcus intermedius]WEG73195.1 2-C-methyl-D-erythritol 2,4-cyclodiphosphate synthase [Vagococcus intermedius]WEG75280.1 2-C-methyl-D-erythritol 2,4-cyclodiphosphate synthase [Vagococcus intermedius]